MKKNFADTIAGALSRQVEVLLDNGTRATLGHGAVAIATLLHQYVESLGFDGGGAPAKKAVERSESKPW